MKKIKTTIEGLFIIENKSFFDERGLFYESWNKRELSKLDLNVEFKQDNISISKKNVIRGLHFQQNPFSQLKLVQVIHGKVMDVIVDLRKDSKTFKKHETIILDADDKQMILIPKGCAHGFLSMEENTVFLYKCSDYYNQENEITILWNDSDLGINWNTDSPIISKKDTNGLTLKEALNKKYI